MQSWFPKVDVYGYVRPLLQISTFKVQKQIILRMLHITDIPDAFREMQR